MKQAYSISKAAKEQTCSRYKVPGMSCYRSTGKTTKREATELVLNLLSNKTSVVIIPYSDTSTIR